MNPHLDGFSQLVAAVIDGIDEGLFRCGIRVVENASRFGAIANLGDTFLDDGIPEIGQGIAQLLIKRPSKDLLVQSVAGDTFGEMDDIDLGCGKKLLRHFIEEE